MNFSKHNIQSIPTETAHDGSGSKKMLFDQNAAESKNWEAVTKGFLPARKVFDWHTHDGVDEMFIVSKGSGKFYCEEEVTDYKVDDVILVRAGKKHKIENTGKEVTEGFFIRIKV